MLCSKNLKGYTPSCHGRVGQNFINILKIAIVSIIAAGLLILPTFVGILWVEKWDSQHKIRYYIQYLTNNILDLGLWFGVVKLMSYFTTTQSESSNEHFTGASRDLVAAVKNRIFLIFPVGWAGNTQTRTGFYSVYLWCLSKYWICNKSISPVCPSCSYPIITIFACVFPVLDFLRAIRDKFHFTVGNLLDKHVKMQVRGVFHM